MIQSHHPSLHTRTHTHTLSLSLSLSFSLSPSGPLLPPLFKDEEIEAYKVE